jgi:hypothetical protein
MDVGDDAWISKVESQTVRLSSCVTYMNWSLYVTFPVLWLESKIKSTTHCALQEQVEILHKTLMKDSIKDVRLRFY